MQNNELKKGVQYLYLIIALVLYVYVVSMASCAEVLDDYMPEDPPAALYDEFPRDARLTYHF